MHSRNTENLSESTSGAITYAIPGLGLEQGPFAFSYVSFFLSFITPHDVPIEIFRDAVRSNVTIVDFAEETLKIESGFIVIMTLFITLSLVPFGFTISWCCRRKPETEEPEDPDDPIMVLDDSIENVLICRRRASVFILFLIYILIALCDVTMFMTNQHFADTVDLAPDLIKASINDVELFLKDTHVQIKKSLDNGFDTAIKNVTHDLEEIDILLGEPIRSEVSASTGVELAFHTLTVIIEANADLIKRVLLLQESIRKSLKISEEAASRMEELQIQLSVLQRQCTFRDRPLCDTLRIRSFEENGIIDALKTLQEDQSISRMRYLGELEKDGIVRNLSIEVGISKSIFGNFPIHVKSETITQRNETIEQLESIKSKTTTMAVMLTHTIISLLDQLSGTWEAIEPHYGTVRELSRILWGLAWTTAATICVVVFFMSATFCCNLCNSKMKAAVILVICVCIICITSIIIMLFGVSALAIGGNGEILLCRTFYGDDGGDQYELLGKIFDKPGLFYDKEPKNGILGELLRPPGSNTSIVNVTLSSVIRNCEQNKASYNVFQLDEFVNTTQMADLKQYPKLNAAIDSIQVSEKSFLSLTENIQNILEHMLQSSDLNLTGYRNAISQPTPDKDVATFIDQMQRVALQIQDVATSARMSTLGARAKRLQVSILQPLDHLRNDILFQLTAVELSKIPWTNQVNQTLIHLNNVQGYLIKSAAEICSNFTKLYIKNLKDYLTANKDKVSVTLGDQTAPCRPLFDIFDANRIFFCRYALDAINGLWFCTLSCLILWCIATPIALNLITIHNKLRTTGRLRHTNSHLYGTPPDTEISEQSNWGAPRTQRPSNNMTRQDSIRSVRWETSEIVFEDDEGAPPSNLV